MLTTILIGFLVSIATEVITWLNAKLSGTVLSGDGAFILAAFVALIAAGVQTYIFPLASWQAFAAQFSVVWASSQVFFITIIQALNLTVKTPASTTTAPTAPLG